MNTCQKRWGCIIRILITFRRTNLMQFPGAILNQFIARKRSRQLQGTKSSSKKRRIRMRGVRRTRGRGWRCQYCRVLGALGPAKTSFKIANYWQMTLRSKYEETTKLHLLLRLIRLICGGVPRILSWVNLPKTNMEKIQSRAKRY